MEKGILYIGTADRFVEEAKRSARRTRKHTDVPIALVAHRQVDSDVFDEIIIDEAPEEGFVDKPRNLTKTPFDKTLFLDADAYLIEDVSEIWEILDDFDLCAAVDANEGTLRQGEETDDYTENLPEAFPEYNTGVLAYTTNSHGFIDQWEQNHDSSCVTDQTSFRYTLFNTEVKFSSLSNNYNCFMSHPTQVCGEVKIVHDFFMRADDKVEGDLKDIINAETRPRILYFNTGRIKSILGRSGILVDKFATLVHKSSAFYTLLSTKGVRGSVKHLKSKRV